MDVILQYYFVPAGVAVILAAAYVVYLYFKKGPERALATYQEILKIAENVVQAVEQQYSDKSGAEKKAIARESIQAILAQLGYQVPDVYIDVAIELAVFAMNRLRKQLEETKKGLESTQLPANVSVNI